MARAEIAVTPTMGDDDNIRPLGVEPVREPEPIPTRPRPLHAFAITGMALSALVGIVSMFLFVTVNWPGSPRRIVIGILFLSAVSFIAFAAAAVFTAARDTYAAAGGRDHRQ